jgi:FtsP/CotA-like multicopper oxidase with cupredoxin domain
MTYKFQADLYGTGWYHSHYTAQVSDGVYGPIVIHGPKNADYDIDLGPIMVSDYYHEDSRGVVERVMSTNLLVSATAFADSTLIQGKMQYDCSKVTDGTPCSNVELAKFQFEPGQTHRLRFINPSSFAVMLVSIDDHDMTVIANDFVPIVPYTTKLLTLAAGQRTDVLVTAKSSIEANAACWLRVRQPPLCALAFQPFALAAIYYNGSNTDLTPTTLPQVDFLTPKLLDCANDDLSLTEPFYAITPAEPDTTIKVDITQYINETGQTLYLMNGHSFRANYNQPALLAAQAGNLTEMEQAPDKNVYNFGSNQTIRIIFQNYLPFSHPMHIHGQNMYVLDEGVGSWDGKTIVRPQNPQRRDTQILQPNGYLVVQLDSDNPGVWPFHCHFASHVSQGLLINIVQKPDEIARMTDVPAVVSDTCQGRSPIRCEGFEVVLIVFTAWNEWTETHVVDQIDSGVKLRFMNARD